MSNPVGFGIVAALAMTSVALAGGNDGKTSNTPTNEPTPQDSINVTAAPGRGITFRADSGFRLNLSNWFQVNLGYRDNENAEDTLGVSIARARTRMMGDAYKDTVHFMMMFEWADGQTSDINDALLMWDFMKSDSGEISLRFGQGKTLFGTEWTGTAAGLEFVDRARASQTFSGVRTRQAQIVGKTNGGALRWNAGLLNGDVALGAIGAGIDDRNNNSNELNWIAGVSYGTGQDEIYGEFRRQGALTNVEETMWVANAAISYGQNDVNDVGAEYDAFTINAGGAMWSGRTHILAEAFVRDESADRTAVAIESQSFGWQAQYSYTLDPGPSIQWGFGGRLSGVHVTDSSGAGTRIFNPLGLGGEGDILEVQVVASAYYVGHNLKTQFGYTFQSIDPDVGSDATNHVVEVQSQIVF